MKKNTKHYRHRLVGALALVLLIGMSSSAWADEVTPTTYVIHQGSEGFPPYDVPSGSTAGGFSVDVMQAICDANSAMNCEFKVGSYSDCLTNVASEPLGLRVGDELTLNGSIGCISWAITGPRVSRGLAFTDSFLTGATAPGTPNSTVYGLGSSANTSGTLYFISGWTANAECATSAGFTYASTATANTPQAMADAAAINGDDFLISNVVVSGITIPAGYSAVEVVDCSGGGGAVMTFPSANLTDVVSFHENFRCGLALIAENGTYGDICLDASGGLDPVQNSPFCVDPTEIAPPTEECEELAEED